jgi:hypothetical protein
MNIRSTSTLAIAAAVALGAGFGTLASSDRAGGGGLPTGNEPVELEPEDFTPRIDNGYSPMRPGDRRVYRVTDAKGSRERAVVKVTDQEKLIANGVTARTVFTKVFDDGELVEDNHAWLAQDERGNVWYFGELAREFENGTVTSTDGSWESGVDGAQPGVIMPARPKVGLAYRQEFAKGVAQDRARIFSLSERVETPLRRFRKRVLLIKETSPLDPRGFLDYKFYARGVGLVLGVEISGGSGREELVRYRDA